MGENIYIRKINTIIAFGTYKTKATFTDIYYLDHIGDTFSVEGIVWITTEVSDNNIKVSGYYEEDTCRDNVSIRISSTSINISDGETIIEQENEATLLKELENTLISKVQMGTDGVNFEHSKEVQ